MKCRQGRIPQCPLKHSIQLTYTCNFCSCDFAHFCSVNTHANAFMIQLWFLVFFFIIGFHLSRVSPTFFLIFVIFGFEFYFLDMRFPCVECKAWFRRVLFIAAKQRIPIKRCLVGQHLAIFLWLLRCSVTFSSQDQSVGGFCLLLLNGQWILCHTLDWFATT